LIATPEIPDAGASSYTVGQCHLFKHRVLSLNQGQIPLRLVSQLNVFPVGVEVAVSTYEALPLFDHQRDVDR
jgi:hypothetical protein